MKFLTINGHEISIQQKSPSNSPESGKIVERGPFGQLMGTRSFAEKNVLELKTTTLTPSEAKAIIGLVRGYGHSFSFDSDIYSDGKGLSPSDWSNVSLVASGGKFGGYLQINPGGYIKYDFSNPIEGINYSQEWTILLWRKLEGTISAQHVSATQVNQSSPVIQDYSFYALKSDGEKFWNGEEKSWLDTSFISMNNGLLTINGDNSNDSLNILIDDLVVLPFHVTSQIISNIFNLKQAFSKLPRLNIAGEVVDREIICEGEVSGWDYKDYFDNGEWIVGRVLDLTLTEV